MFRCPDCGAFNRVPADRSQYGEPVCGRCKKPLPLTGAPQEVNSEAFERAISSAPVPVLVDFWAEWCAPCRASGPILERLAKANAGRLVVLKVNTEKDPGPPSRLGIQGIPAFVLFREGQEISRQAGLMPFEAMNRWIAQMTVTAAA